MRNLLVFGRNKGLHPETLSMLRNDGCEVVTLVGRRGALRLIGKRRFDAAVIRMEDPESDFKTLRLIRTELGNKSLPVLVVGPAGDVGLVEHSFAAGADSFVPDTCGPAELAVRIQARACRTRELADLSPLTHLPGNLALADEIRSRLQRGRSFAVACADLRNFKAVNDFFGVSFGDSFLRYVARTLAWCVDDFESNGGFVGHLGGDDFGFLTEQGSAERVANAVLASFDRGAEVIFRKEVRLALSGRAGEHIGYPFVSLHIGIVSALDRRADAESLLTRASELRSQAKKSKRSSWVADWQVSPNG